MNEIIANKYKSKDCKAFWKEVKKRRGNCDTLISEIDSQKSNVEIVNVFHKKFSSVTGVNSQTNATTKFCPNVNFRNRLSSRCVNNAIKALSPGVGYDALHSNHLKFSSPVMILTSLFTRFIFMHPRPPGRHIGIDG